MSDPVIVIPPYPVKASFSSVSPAPVLPQLIAAVSTEHVDMPLASTQYTYTLPVGSTGFFLQIVDSDGIAKWYFDIAFAPFTATNFMTHRGDSGLIYLNTTSLFTLYFRCALPNRTAQIQTYT